MTGESRCATMIERYLCTRGRRFFRGAHDAEYFYVANAQPRRLHVHLEISHGDVLIIRVAPPCFFPATGRPRLMHFADEWNRQNHEVTAIVHDSTDPQRIGVVARRSQRIQGHVTFEEFASFVDRAVAAAIDLFGALTPVADLPSSAQALVRDAG
ncbi:MAG: YbjN domain-containing protein [Mycobacterium sp.]|uniref:YbjN domain-containing protein n=1 Tax=Mycobacterium sp. TaxID=1785 RepID=UPI003F9E6D58